MIGPIIAAGITGAASMLGQRSANRANAREADINRKFQEQMSNTSYQRAMHDMRASGLNPMLAFMKGGASTPGGSQPANMQNELGIGANSAMEMARLTAEYDKIRKDTQLSEAMTKNQQADTVLKGATSAKTLAEAKKLGFDTEKSEAIGSVYNSLNFARDALVHGKWKLKEQDADRPGDKRYFFNQVRVRRKGEK